MMRLVLTLIVGLPVLWLLGLIYYMLAWFDWDLKHSRIPK